MCIHIHTYIDRYVCIHTHSQADSVSMCTNNAKTTATVASDKSRQDFYTHSHTRTTIEAFAKTSRHPERDNNNSNKSTNSWRKKKQQKTKVNAEKGY